MSRTTTPGTDSVSSLGLSPSPTVSLQRTPRFTRVFVLMLAAYALWASGVLVVHAYNQPAPGSARQVELCPMKLAVGLPCPTCGGTRAVSELATLSPARAWHFNPLLTVLVPLAAALIGLRVIAGLVVCVRLSRSGRRVAWTAATLALLLNWAWVLSIGN